MAQVYELEIEGKKYIGQSTSAHLRFRQHFQRLMAGRHENPLVQQAFQDAGGRPEVIVFRLRSPEISSTEARGLEVRIIREEGALNINLGDSRRGKEDTPLAQRCGDLRAQGLTYQGIANELGITLNRAWRACKK